MYSKCLVAFFVFSFSFNYYSQKDSVEFIPGTNIPDGIYLSYSDFRSNKIISKDQIVSNQNKNQLEFISKALSEETIKVKSTESEVQYVSKNVWAYFQNNTFYINYKGDFYRVPVFGSISFLVAYVSVLNPAFYDPRFAMSSPASTSKELKEFLMNFYDGELREFTLKTAEELISRDAALFNEYNKLNKRKRKDEIHKYIRRFNTAHPIYFLK